MIQAVRFSYTVPVVPLQSLTVESAKLSEAIVVGISGREHHFSMFANSKETFDLLEQLTKIAIMELVLVI